MSLISLTAPSKTFLVGEYIALSGGPTLVLNTEPRFKLTAQHSDTKNPCKQQGMRASSPAGKLLKLFQEEFTGFQLSFQDPHKGTGGFGASSAQFAMVYTLKQLANKQHNIDLAVTPILNLYQQCSWLGQGLPPSGADVIAQINGEITFYHANQRCLEKLSWPFIDIDFCLIRTGQKIATHRHLSTLTTDAFHDKQLMNIALATHQALLNNHSTDFVHCIQGYGKRLEELNLVAEHSTQLLQQIIQHPHVLATKGCGALGADVILVLFELEHANSLLGWFKQLSLNVVVSSHKQLSPGIENGDSAQIQLTI